MAPQVPFVNVPFGAVLRFRDNILLIALMDWSCSEILLWLHSLYDLDFSKEQAGHHLKVLECDIHWHCANSHKFFDRFSVGWGPLFELPPARVTMGKKSWVHPLSCNAKHLMASYVPSAMLKCGFYACSLEEAESNRSKFVELLHKNGYPCNWWRGIVSQTWVSVGKGIR